MDDAKRLVRLLKGVRLPICTGSDLTAQLLAKVAQPADRIVMIDLPQVVDVVGNPKGMEFLLRDCHNMAAWFTNRGLEIDEQELFADLLTMVF